MESKMRDHKIIFQSPARHLLLFPSPRILAVLGAAPSADAVTGSRMLPVPKN